MRSNTKIDMMPLAITAPPNARFQSTPTAIIGGAINSVRASVQPKSFTPEPLSPSSTVAAVRYEGNAG